MESTEMPITLEEQVNLMKKYVSPESVKLNASQSTKSLYF